MHNRPFVDSAEAIPSNLLSSHDAELVCKWLSRFVLETRKSDGSPYPPATLRSLVSGLNRVLQIKKAPFSVLDKSDHRFRDFLKTLDSLSSELHRQGVGVSKNSAKVIDPSHEDILWASSLLGYSSPKVILPPRFFSVLYSSMWGSILCLGVYKNNTTFYPHNSATYHKTGVCIMSPCIMNTLS